MGKNSSIEWCEHTANLWWGCVEIANHPGCEHCYARVWDRRMGGDHWGARSSRRAIKGVWKELAKYQREAEKEREIHRVFVGSMMDIFERSQPLVNHKGEAIPGTTDDLRRRFFSEVVPASPNLIFLLLTKRPGNILRMIPESWQENPPHNVMYGCSVSDQETAKRYIPQLLEVPGRRFLSVEPLIGPVDLSPYLQMQWLGLGEEEAMLHWVIVGAESGHGARPMHPKWARDIRDQCSAAGVSFFFKQWGAWIPKAQIATFNPNGDPWDKWQYMPEFEDLSGVAWGCLDYDGTFRPETTTWNGRQEAERDNYEVTVFRVGKKRAHRMLDGQEWNEFPWPAEVG